MCRYTALFILIVLVCSLLNPMFVMAKETDSLMLYCAAGIRYAVEEVIQDYKKEYGIEVQPTWAGSGALISIMDVARKGDLYLAADEDHIQIARDKGLVLEAIPIAYQRPVIAVRKGNPRKIQSLDDLLQDGLTISLANETASIGKKAIAVLKKFDLWEKVKAHVDRNGVYKPTVNEVANDLLLGMADAGIVWDTTVLQYGDRLEMIPIADTDEFIEQVTISVLEFSKYPTSALAFARYLTARDRGLVRFKEKGWPVVKDADVWAETPQVTYFAGGVNRRAIEETIKEFSEREGVIFNTTYNGCGILVGQIKLGQRPDVYHTCDASFMPDVESLFLDIVPVSTMRIVILVAPSHIDKIKSIDDLLKPGIRLGMGNPQQSAMGSLTVKMLEAMGKWEAFEQSNNIATMVPTGEYLIAPILSGNLDAALCYESNATLITEQSNAVIIPIDHPKAFATQTYTVSKQSKHKYLMNRFLDALARTKDRYEEAGFGFKLDSTEDGSTSSSGK